MSRRNVVIVDCDWEVARGQLQQVCMRAKPYRFCFGRVAATDETHTRLQYRLRTLTICDGCRRHRWHGRWHTYIRLLVVDIQVKPNCEAWTRLGSHWCMRWTAGDQGRCLVVHCNWEYSQLLCWEVVLHGKWIHRMGFGAVMRLDSFVDSGTMHCLLAHLNSWLTYFLPYLFIYVLTYLLS